MTAPAALVPLARWWHVSGLAADLVGLPEVAAPRPLLLVDGESGPRRVPAEGWCVAPACDYCDQPARFQMRPEHGSEVLCRECSRSQHDTPSDWVRPITRACVRRLYPAVAEAGMRRLLDQLVEAA